MTQISDNRTTLINYLSGKTVAVLGYRDNGAQQQAQYLRNHGIKVVIGLRDEDECWDQAEKDGFKVYSVWNAVEHADVAQVW
jgi:ketol-acid reductoisomerase